MNIQTSSTEQLESRLGAIVASVAEGVHEGCLIIHELHKRGEYRPYMAQGPFRFWREVAEGKLTAAAVLGFGGVKPILAKVAKLPAEQQEELLHGAPIVVVEHDEHGHIYAVAKEPMRLSQAQWDLAIGDAGYRDIDEQKAILAARGPDVRRSSSVAEFRIDTATGEIVVGRIRLDIRDVLYRCAKAGYHTPRFSKLGNAKIANAKAVNATHLDFQDAR